MPQPLTRREYSLLLVVRMQNHLLITTLKVQSGEPFGSSQRVQNVVNPGQWESLSL
jgi:hypothetical protein